MKSTTKLELAIILAAIILAIIVLASFWGLNHKELFMNSQNKTTPAPVYETTGPKPVTASPSTEQKSNKALGLAKLTEPVTLNALIIGDTVAESSGASNIDTSWYTLVANNLKSKYPGTIQWAFKTTTAATIEDALKYLPEITQDTDLVILCLGRNDWATLTTNDFRQKYGQFLEEFKAKHPQADLFLVTEPPVINVANNNKSFPYRQVILDLGREHQVSVIDQWSAFINDPTPLNGLLADQSNPNNRGYQLFADQVLKAFEDRLSLAH